MRNCRTVRAADRTKAADPDHPLDEGGHSVYEANRTVALIPPRACHHKCSRAPPHTHTHTPTHAHTRAITSHHRAPVAPQPALVVH
jgi:hypothetical protein